MKKISMIILFVFALKSIQAQTFNEWFAQKKTQIEYLVNQIGALQIYIEYAQKGYQIVDQGLTTISAIKSGDFNLHNDFFNALKNVNPKIRNAAQVADIIALQIRIIQAQKNALQKIKSTEQLRQKEIDYITRVYFRLLEQTAENVATLTVLITANNLELSDDERLQRINTLHADMQDKYQFARWFSDQTNVLIFNRRKEISDSKTIQSLFIEKE